MSLSPNVRAALTGAAVLLVACGSSSSSPAPDASATDAAPRVDSGPANNEAGDACPTSAQTSCGCTTTTAFAPVDAGACADCLNQNCTSQLMAYEASCWIVQSCMCSCSGFDDTCSNNAQPFYACGHSTCAVACSADGGAAADARPD